MTQLSIYQVYSFATSLFTGNSAAVCPLVSWLNDQTLQAIATENNVSETAFRYQLLGAMIFVGLQLNRK